MTQHIQNFDVKGGPQLGRDHLPLLRETLTTFERSCMEINAEGGSLASSLSNRLN